MNTNNGYILTDSIPSIFNGIFSDVEKIINNKYPIQNESISTRLKVDVEDFEDKYVLKANIPGIANENIDIQIEKNSLKLNVKSARENKESSQKFLLRERTAISASRVLNFPVNISSEGVNATLKDGVLTVEIKKEEPIKPKKIDVISLNS